MTVLALQIMLDIRVFAACKSMAQFADAKRPGNIMALAVASERTCCQHLLYRIMMITDD